MVLQENIGNALCGIPYDVHIRNGTQDVPYHTLENKRKKELHGQFLLGLLNKLFFALGAGDGNFAFSLGYSHLLAATGTIVITVILIL